jgi:hypothetical protein
MAKRKSNTVRSASWNESSVSQHGILLVAPADIAAYLDAHADLAAIVPSACAQARREFGKNAELALSVYRDPEIDDHYLKLNVRLPAYDDAFADQLERVSEPFDAELCRASGYFLVTTDLRKVQAKHVI